MPITRREIWEAKLSRNCARDLENLSRLKACGWDTFIVWECSLDDVTGLRQELTRFLGPPRASAGRTQSINQHLDA